MSEKKRFVEDVSNAVRRLFADGMNDPRASDIAEELLPNLSGHPGDLVAVVRKRLKKVRDHIEEHDDLPVHLVNETYYSKYRNDLPKTDTDARRCIAGIGQGSSAEGIRLPDGPDDRVYRAALTKGLASGGGKVAANLDRAASALDKARLTPDEASKLVKKLEDVTQKAREDVRDRLDREQVEQGEKPALEAGPDE